MSVTAFSIADGNIIKAADADYETYRDRLPVCGTCFGEICLARGERKNAYWRHFPGVGIGCPDKSDIKTIIYKSSDRINRKQSLALFKQRFLDILDIGLQPTFALKTGTHKYSFNEPKMLDIACLINIKCVSGMANFNTVMLDICNKHRKRTDIIAALTNISVNQLYNSQFVNLDVGYELKKQIGQITMQYLSIQESTTQLATSYVFTPGKEDILKQLMAYCWILHANNKVNCTKDELPVHLIVTSTALLAGIPWYRIMTALIEKRKPQTIPIGTGYALSFQGIQILTNQFQNPLPKPKPQGFKHN